MAKDAAGIRRVWVDSGPAGTSDPGERIMAFIADRWFYAVSGEVQFLQGRTTLEMCDTMGIPLPSPPIARRPYMEGFEGSDLVGVYFALDKLGEIAEGQTVEILGDGQVFDFLQGIGKVSAKYAGKNWAPEMRERIREAEAQFPKVVYRTIASSQNRADALVERLKRQNKDDYLELRYGYGQSK
jgi:hypothetical protein